MKKHEISDVMDVFVVWTNTDCTEGRGYQYPIHVCQKRSTAIRLSKRKGVQGSDAQVTTGLAVKVNGSWLADVRIERPTAEDDKAQAIFDAKDAVIAKLVAAGISDEELQMIGVNK